jgi:predicted methyltransferase/ribosomal protein S18 acetylase RimI-like enzyme
METPETEKAALPDKLLNDVAQATSLREGAEGIAQILRTIFSHEPISLKELSQKSRLPLPVLAAVRKELERAGITARHPQGISLTPKGLKFVGQKLNINTKAGVTLESGDAQRVVITEKFLPALEKLKHYFRQRPPVDVTRDQTHALPESSIRRVLYMYQAGALEGKNVLFIGDDDSVSLATALIGRALGRDKFAERLTVVEADERIIAFINQVSEAESLSIECVRHDLRDSLPEHLLQKFDTFETDPPYTLEGLNLFVSRAVSGLKSGIGQQGFLSFGHKSPDESLEIHRSLLKMGLVVNDLMPSFNEYEGASIIGGASRFFHLLSTQATTPLISASRYDDAIYTAESAPTTRLYRCVSCKTLIEVGHGREFTTIEKLKDAQCPTCGSRNFRFEGRKKANPEPRAPRLGEIRPARAEDLAEIVKLEIEIVRISFPDDPIDDPEIHLRKFTKALERGEKGMFVMTSENRVAGWLWITINSHFLEQVAYGNIRSVAAHPDWRRKGVGRELVKFAIDYCERHDAKWITTKVHANNEAMKNLYLDLGFQIKHLTMERRFSDK